MSAEDDRLVRPDGLAIRGLRHGRGWSPRELAAAITEAHVAATGLPIRVAPRVLTSIEERNALVSWDTLCTIAAGLDCNPIEILLEDPPIEPETGLHAPGDPAASRRRNGGLH